MIRCATLCLAVITALAAVPARAAFLMGTAFTYQGELLDAGAPVQTPVDLEFSLWDDPVAGNLIAGPLSFPSEPITDGLFTVPLDFGPAAFNGTARWLQISVGPEGGPLTPLDPRQELTPAPHALALPGLYTQQNATSPNVIAGREDNAVTDGVFGGTISGGGDAGSTNAVTDNFGTVSGGANNRAGTNNANVTDARYATVGGGLGNSATSNYTTVAGGQANTTSQAHASVGGGRSNNVSAQYGTIAGGGPSNTADVFGTRNRVTDSYGAIGGGGNNLAGDNAGTNSDRPYATVSGGEANQATGAHSTIAGGLGNLASGVHSNIAGGSSNSATGDNSTVAGGEGNTALVNSTVGGGVSNFASGGAATIAGGTNNGAGYIATVGGGTQNIAGGNLSTVAGGEDNWANGAYSTVAGGLSNRALGTGSFAAGQSAQALHDGAFVWSDGSLPLASTAPNQFLVSAAGGVGIGTAAPAANLHLAANQPSLRLQDDDDPASYSVLLDVAPTQMKIEKAGASGPEVLVDVNPRPLDGVSNAFVRFFRETNTTGQKAVHFLRGNNTSQNSASIGVDGTDSFFQLHGGNLGIGTSAPGARLDVSAPTGWALRATAAATGLTGAALRADNTHAAGIGLYCTTNSSDANTVLANPGTGDLLRGFSGPGGSNLVYRIHNNGSATANGGIVVDNANANSGSLTSALTFGAGSGEGVASKRTAGGNLNGLDFYTNFVNRMAITNGGNLGIGTTEPSVKVQIEGGTDVEPAGGGYLQIGSAGSNIAIDNNEIMARQNGGTFTLRLNIQGGHVTISDTSSDGRLGVGRSPAANRLEVEGNASKTTSGSWLANSDARIKTDVKSVAGALDTLEKVRLVNFRYTDEYLRDHPTIEDRRYLNVLAQEFAEIFPDHVKPGGDTLPNGEAVLQVDTYPLTIYSAAAIQELHAQLREKDAQLADLAARLERLERAQLAPR